MRDDRSNQIQRTLIMSDDKINALTTDKHYNIYTNENTRKNKTNTSKTDAIKTKKPNKNQTKLLSNNMLVSAITMMIVTRE